MSDNTILRGRKQIVNFMGWGTWRRVARLLPQGFPAKMVDGVWYSDKQEIRHWLDAQFRTGQNEDGER